MFLLRNDIDKIMHGESKAEKEARLKKTHMKKYHVGKESKQISRGKTLSLLALILKREQAEK